MACGFTFTFPKLSDVLAHTGMICYVHHYWLHTDEQVFIKCMVVRCRGKSRLVVIDRLNSEAKEGFVLDENLISERIFPIGKLSDNVPFSQALLGSFFFYDGKLCTKTADAMNTNVNPKTAYGYVRDIFKNNYLPVSLVEPVDLVDCTREFPLGDFEIRSKGLVGIM